MKNLKNIQKYINNNQFINMGYNESLEEFKQYRTSLQKFKTKLYKDFAFLKLNHKQSMILYKFYQYTNILDFDFDFNNQTIEFKETNVNNSKMYTKIHFFCLHYDINFKYLSNKKIELIY